MAVIIVLNYLVVNCIHLSFEWKVHGDFFSEYDLQPAEKLVLDSVHESFLYYIYPVLCMYCIHVREGILSSEHGP